MINAEEKEFTSGMLGKSVVAFLINFIIQIGIVVLLTFLTKGSGYASYVSKNLSVFLFVLGCMFLMYWIMYLYHFFEDKSFLAEPKKIWVVFIAMDLSLALFHVIDLLSVHARPVALFALLVLFLVNYREAAFMNIIYAVTVFLIDLFLQYDVFRSSGIESGLISTFMVCFIGGMFSLFFGKNVRTRAGILCIIPIVIVPSIIISTLLEISTLTVSPQDYLIHLGFGALGGVFSIAAFTVLLPFFEVTFGILTVFRLHELTSTNAKLLKRLRTEAPGTFNHSVVVAQLAETCATELGEESELARAAAYYHDVGKLRQPEFFTENQGSHNLHDELSPELSAEIIRSHAKDGADILKSYRLPEFFADVARQHHGTMPITYFYTKALRMSDGELRVEDYSYVGPKPKSKIAAIIMIADSAEAATRSLKDRTPENVEKVVRSIIQQRMDLEQFSDCNVTMAELQTIKNTLVGALTGVYHHRIKYPDVRFTRTGEVEDNGGSVYDRNK